MTSLLPYLRRVPQLVVQVVRADAVRVALRQKHTLPRQQANTNTKMTLVRDWSPAVTCFFFVCFFRKPHLERPDQRVPPLLLLLPSLPPPLHPSLPAVVAPPLDASVALRGQQRAVACRRRRHQEEPEVPSIQRTDCKGENYTGKDFIGSGRCCFARSTCR